MVEVLILALAAAIAAAIWRGGQAQNEEPAWQPVRVDDWHRKP